MVEERVQIVLTLQAARGVECQIMVDELAQLGVCRWDAAFLRVRVGLLGLIVGTTSHGRAEARERGLSLIIVVTEFGRWQRAEDPSERTLEKGRAG